MDSGFENSKVKKSPLGWFVLASILLHVLVIEYQVRHNALLEPLQEKVDTSPVEITEVPPEYYSQEKPTVAQAPKKKPKEDLEKQMAETEDAKNREIDPNAKFLGENNQKSEQQLRAKQVDDFRTKQGTGEKGKTPKPEGWIPPQGDESEEIPSEMAQLDEGVGLKEAKKPKGIKRDWKTLSLQDLSVGGNGGVTAATDDRLNGVAEGERTILSTREFKFYSYYHRIKELLRQYWKPNVERQLARVWGKGKNVSEEELTTKVLVLLDERGKIQKISKLAGCGLVELDEAAVDAFQRAAPFPNPPPGMIDDDGFVRIRWDFILTTDSSPRIQWRTVGSAPR